ncbi:septum formation family protein [Microbacterium sp. NPDC058345]|uniref:septum formation family protein n=1 Tax=Microbacterium sp. NPDC058345 TaxID=3346455 RepID=UPI003656B752
MLDTRIRRVLTVTAAAILFSAMLSGCGTITGIINGGDAQRDRDGRVTEEKQIDIFSLKVGDCLTADALTGGETTSAPVVPCEQAHPFEVYAEFDLEDGEFPGTEAIEEPATEFCEAEFATFVGVGYQESSLAYTWFEPTAESWSADDRLVQCIIGDPEGDVQGSLAGVKR